MRRPCVTCSRPSSGSRGRRRSSAARTCPRRCGRSGRAARPLRAKGSTIEQGHVAEGEVRVGKGKNRHGAIVAGRTGWPSSSTTCFPPCSNDAPGCPRPAKTWCRPSPPTPRSATARQPSTRSPAGRREPPHPRPARHQPQPGQQRDEPQGREAADGRRPGLARLARLPGRQGTRWGWRRSSASR